MKSQPKVSLSRGVEWLPAAFAGLFGAFLGLSLLKFGNPPIMEKWVTTPGDVYEFLLGYPWPINWAYWLLAMISAAGLLVARVKLAAPRWLVALPLAWLVWQIVAGVHTFDAQLTEPTLKHFTACVVCFYLGMFSLSWVRPLWLFWLGLSAGLLLVLAIGWQQHFGGLAESRQYFQLYVYPQMNDIPPEYLKKIMSNRIWATLFYPNALAGVLLLLLPPALGLIATARHRFTAPARWFLCGTIGIAGLGCLYWSGSKGGWLLMLFLGLIALLRLPFRKSFKIGLLSLVLLGGLAGFFWKYSTFFKQGATSVSARFDYWRAALQTVRDQPILGTGPGTFAIPYQKIKRPESEMSRLVHNDYLEQASDSGLPGFALYGAFIVGGLVWAFPRSTTLAANRDQAPSSAPPLNRSPNRNLNRPHSSSDVESNPEHDWTAFAVWLGVLGWALQGFFEFGLYIPALAWPAFTLLGWLLGRNAMSPKPIDKPRLGS